MVESYVRHWADVAAIQDLVCRERHWRDREDWALMRSAYTDDAQIRVTWFSGTIDEYVEDSRQPSWDLASIVKHRVSPPLVTLRGERALAETSTVVELRLSGTGTPFDAEVSVRLLSRVVRTEEGWKLASMDAIYEKDAMRPVYPADLLQITAEDTAPYRRSYQFLAFGGAGRLAEDIPGDDRPELVEALYAAAQQWLDGDSALSPVRS